MKEIITKNRSLLEETEKLLNDQIKLEGVSSAIYRSMASWAEIKGYEKSAEFLYDHSEEEKMHIVPPVDPLFRVGELGLGYDKEEDLVVLISREIIPEDEDAKNARVVRFWCSRSQIRSMCRWGIEVASRGRPLCPQCGEPMDPEGHFCPKKNGHKH